LWLPKDDLQDSPPLLLIRDIHSTLLDDYGCKKVCVPSQSQTQAGGSGGLSSQNGDAQQQETAPLLLPHLNRFSEAYHVWGENASNVTTISSQHRVTMQILDHWQSLRNLKLVFEDSRRVEQLGLHSQQRIVVIVKDSVLRTEMTGLESQEEDTPKCILFFKPMS
jgi:hypothetical protein